MVPATLSVCGSLGGGSFGGDSGKGDVVPIVVRVCKVPVIIIGSVSVVSRFHKESLSSGRSTNAGNRTSATEGKKTA